MQTIIPEDGAPEARERALEAHVGRKVVAIDPLAEDHDVPRLAVEGQHRLVASGQIVFDRDERPPATLLV